MTQADAIKKAVGEFGASAKAKLNEGRMSGGRAIWREHHRLCAYIMRMTRQFQTGAPGRPPVRRGTNLSLDPAYVAEARELGINLSKACENGLLQEIRRARAERWREDNRSAIESSNAFVEANGLPLAKKRLF